MTDVVSSDYILDAIGAVHQTENRYLALCAYHGDKNPSLAIYKNSGGKLFFKCLSKGCSQSNIVAALEKAHNVIIPDAMIYTPSRSQNQDSSNTVYPAHVQAFPDRLRKPNDIVYEYTTSSGEIAFFVHRFQDDNGVKQIRPWFSKKENIDGEIKTDLSPKDPPKSGRPLFNLHELSQNPKAKVIVVEGEKAALAVRTYDRFKAHIPVTWSGGAKALSKSDWSVLKNRDTNILLWPDNDTTGIEAMKEISTLIGRGPSDNRLSFIDYSKTTPGRVSSAWDVADGFSNDDNSYSLSELLEVALIPFKPVVSLGSMTNPQAFEFLETKLERFIKPSGEVVFFDKTQRMRTSPLGYAMYNSEKSLALAFNETIAVQGEDEKTKKVNPVLVWPKKTRKEMFRGLEFDPSSTEMALHTSEGLKINLFGGLPDFGTESSNNLVDLFQEYMRGLIANDTEREWLIDYMANSLQNPHIKPQTALLIQGEQETGKTTFSLIWGAVIGEDLWARADVTGSADKTGAYERSLLIVQDEFEIDYKTDVKAFNQLKDKITAATVKIEDKWVKAYGVSSYHRFVFTTNNAHAVALPPRDRRFMIVQVTEKLIGNTKLFEGIYNIIAPTHNKNNPARLAAMNGFKRWLLERKTKNPAVCKPLWTEAKTALTKLNDPALEYMRQIYDSGQLPHSAIKYFMSKDLQKFGKVPVRIHQQAFRQMMMEDMPRRMDKLGMESIRDMKEVFTEKSTSASGKCRMYRNLSYLNPRTGQPEYMDEPSYGYTLWSLEEGRKKIEEYAKTKLSWSDAGRDYDEKEDEGNVIDLDNSRPKSVF